MQKLHANTWVYSPSDLTTYMSSPFASWMDRYRLVVKDRSPSPDPEDPLMASLQKRGFAHEEELLSDLMAEGRSIIRIDQASEDIDQMQVATLEAMHSGVDVIFQAVLALEPFRGYADFLVKTEGPSKLGDYHYEVWDTKLSSKPKPLHLIQLCCYSEMLEPLQKRRPSQVVVALGNTERVKFRTEDFYYYYLALKDAFLKDQAAFDPEQVPNPADSKEYGRWSQYAEQILKERDHLFQIANITRSQIKKMNQAGIHTCEQLISYSGDLIKGLSKERVEKIQEQARIQKLSNGAVPPRYEIKSSGQDGSFGLDQLPPHSPLDIFFDIEGYPLEEGGLEYLWGASYFDNNGRRQFKDFWGHNEQQEREAFKGFVSWSYERWQQDPSMHIYHYANYEIAACKKLMGRYGVCEMEVDQLLRHGVFIDLYKIVKGSLLLGEPRYSIKNVEHLYRGARETDVGTGGDSVVVYEQWCDQPDGDDWQSSAILKSIRDYNEDDCHSTQELVEWLREKQQEAGITYQQPEPIEDKPLSDVVTERTQLKEQLLRQAEHQEEAQARLTENLAWMLEFHRRESKPVFWRLFERMGMAHIDLLDDIDCIACCQRTDREAFKDTARARNLSYEYRFDPTQEFKYPKSKQFHLLDHESVKVAFVEEESDLGQGVIVVKHKEAPSDLISLIPDEYVNPSPIDTAIDERVKQYSDGQLGPSAINDFLNRSLPRFEPPVEGPIITTLGEARLLQIIERVHQLNKSYLTLQGPPGAGKSYTGKKIIASLMQKGARVGICSNSHKAINHLLVSAVEECQQQGISINAYCTKDTGSEIFEAGVEIIKNGQLHSVMEESSTLVGTTAWGFAREDMLDQLDYLFIDEAGQVSLANLLAISRSARNLVIMGDQMQLGQPLQGSHPADSGLSILDYLLHQNPIIPPDMGIFLDTTYRMHSSVNQFVSDAIYEGQLKADASNDLQTLSLNCALSRYQGVVYIPCEHKNNTQASDEEVEQIVTLAKQMIGGTYTDKNGDQHRIGWRQMLFVAPYNHQVTKLQIALGAEARVGSVDKFQGQEAPIVFFSFCTSDASESPRGIDFIFDGG